MRWRLPLLVCGLLVFGLLGAQLLRRQASAPLLALDEQALPAARTPKQQQHLQSLPTGEGNPMQEVVPGLRSSLHRPFELTLRHAEDRTPLFACGVWIPGSNEPKITGPGGTCHFPAGLPFGQHNLRIDLDGDGAAELTASVDHQDDSIELALPNVMTLLLDQEPGTPRFDNIAVVKRSWNGDGHDSKRLVRPPANAAGFPWIRTTSDQLSSLVAWDLMAYAGQKTGRRPLRNRPGSQVLKFDLRGKADFYLDLPAYEILDPKTSLYELSGQSLDLRGVARKDPQAKGMHWAGLREGRYRVTVESLSHDFWEEEFSIESTDLTLMAHLNASSSKPLTAQLILLEPGEILGSEQAAMLDWMHEHGLELIFTLGDAKPWHIQVPINATNTLEGGLTATIDLALVRDEPWIVTPRTIRVVSPADLDAGRPWFDVTDYPVKFEPASQTWSDAPLRFRRVKESDESRRLREEEIRQVRERFGRRNR